MGSLSGTYEKQTGMHDGKQGNLSDPANPATGHPGEALIEHPDYFLMFVSESPDVLFPHAQMDVEIKLDHVLRGLSKGEESPLEELYNYYYPRLYEFSRSFLKQEQDIDDILQEVFIRIWQNRKKIKDPATFNSYIFTITRNLLLNKLRSVLNQQKLKDEIRGLSLAKEYENIDLVQYRELKNNLEGIINELPERQKEIFVLSRTEGLSHKEIADRLQVTTKTVEYHISLAIKFLKVRLQGLGMNLWLLCLCSNLIPQLI